MDIFVMTFSGFGNIPGILRNYPAELYTTDRADFSGNVAQDQPRNESLSDGTGNGDGSNTFR